jgi:hypothetical protein
MLVDYEGVSFSRNGFVIPLAVALLELCAIEVYHPSIAVVRVVVAGHCTLNACCLSGVLRSLTLGNVVRRSESPSR